MLACVAPIYEASALTPIYGGGDPAATAAIDALGQCLGAQNAQNPGATVANSAGCAAATNPQYDYLNTATSNADGLTALVTLTPPATASGTGTAATDGNFPAYPYRSWELTASDIPLDSPGYNDSPTNYYSGAYSLTAQVWRGRLWQLPFAIEGLAFPYNLPRHSFSAAGTNYSGVVFGTGFLKPVSATATVPDPAGGTATVTELDLSKDMLCYIWTQHKADGGTVSGTYTWDNQVFTGSTYYYHRKTFVSSYDANIVPASVSRLPILPVIYPNSGRTYILTLWLRQNCAAYSQVGYGSAAANTTFPSFITADGLSADSGAGVAALVADNPGAIGYTEPGVVSPASNGAPPAAFLLAGAVKKTGLSPFFLYPSASNIGLSAFNLKLPKNFALTSWGSAMDRLLLKNASTNSGYPMVGFSFLMGYTCYVNDSVNDEFTGVTTLVDFLQEPMASIIIAEKGLNPLLSTSYAAEIALLHTKLTGVSATPDNSSGVPIYGPSACPAFADNPTNYQ